LGATHWLDRAEAVVHTARIFDYPNVNTPALRRYRPEGFVPPIEAAP
jgi:hypothetical protein